MEQCKVFFGNPEDVQLEVNEWLRNNKNVKMVSRKVASCSVSADIRYLGILTHAIQIVLFYNEK